MTAYPGDLFQHLESFAVLAAHLDADARGAFEHAAQDLAVDRSVLRRRIHTLSEWLESPLLQGRGAQLRPSPAGKRLVERAASLLTAARQLKTDVALAPSRVTIACTGSITTELLPRVLLDLEREPHAVQLSIKRAGGVACERLVRDRVVDLGVVRSEVPPPELASQHLVDDRLWLILPSSHPWAKARARPSLEAMATLPLILYGATSRTRARVMGRLGPLGASIRAEVDGKAAALEFVRVGLGASFLSLLPGGPPSCRGVWARDVTALFGAARFYVVGRKDRWRESALVHIVRRLTEQAHRRGRT